MNRKEKKLCLSILQEALNRLDDEDVHFTVYSLAFADDDKTISLQLRLGSWNVRHEWSLKELLSRVTDTSFIEVAAAFDRIRQGPLRKVKA